MLTRVADLNFITRSIMDEDCFSVHPVLNTNKTVRELFKVNFFPYENVLVYVYIWHPDEEKLITGRISTCYDTWFLLRQTPINDLERLDFLYTHDHLEDLEDKESIGIIYKKDKTT